MTSHEKNTSAEEGKTEEAIHRLRLERAARMGHMEVT
jgi:hypothetical protein